jgi:alanyl-tRNA synthetase
VTERLYYHDAYAREFDAAVVGVDAVSERPGHFAAVLDRTAFFPTSGGQPFDTGTLGTARVVDVIDGDDGRILHLVEGPIELGPTRGVIDWPRRFEHMQQHTGQHVLSAAFERLLNVSTVSFHLGSTASTIDLAREVTPAEIARAEHEANRVVWENRPVTIRFADVDEVAALPLRKESKRDGVLRLVDVENFDVSACGGTHVARTGAIGIIAIAAFEKFKGGTRLEFLCGGRALAGYHGLRDTVAASVRLLSVLPAELPAAIDRGQTDARDRRRQVKDLQTRLAGHEANTLSERAERVGAARVVLAALEVGDGWDANGLKSIATAIAARPGHAAVLISVPEPSAIVIARAPDVGVDSATVLKQLTAMFGGKGGGRPELAQGGGLKGDAKAILGAARTVISE